MKQITFLLLVQVYMVPAVAQKMSAPCCSIIEAIPGAPCCNVITVRNNTTGRTFEFTADNSVAQNYTKGTPLFADPSAGIIKSVTGAVSKYAIKEPAKIEPCCGIVSIVYSELCCGLVSVSQINGDRFSFSVPKNIATNLKIDQKVSIQYFQPVDGDKYQPVDGDKYSPVDGYAVVQSSEGYGIKAKKATYTFPILKSKPGYNKNTDSSHVGGYDVKNDKAAKHETDNSLFNDKPWEIKPNLTARGATGRLIINIPKDAECIITISQPVTERQVVYSISDRSFALVPGTYDVTVSGKKTKDLPVQKGMDTRIKGGALNVVATGTWTLYDEKKDRQVYYSNSPKKIGLPIGTYQMDINGTMQEIKIKDGETVEF